jgi:hypothetical protein
MVERVNRNGRPCSALGNATKVTLALLGTLATFAAMGCVRARVIQVRVVDPGAVGVVTNDDNHWLIAPHGPPQDVDVYSNFATKDYVSRSTSNDLHYVSRHWSLRTVVDDTLLVDARGNVAGYASGAIVQTIHDGHAVRLPITQVTSTGGFGCDPDAGCESSPAVRMSLVTESRNVHDVIMVDKPVRGFGLLEMLAGTPMLGFGAIDGVINLVNRPTYGRNTLLGVDAGLTAIGGALVANALWYLLTPERRTVLYATDASSR